MAASEPSHWCLRTYLPCWFITIRLSVASTVFGMENSLLAFSVIVPFMSYISLATCKNSCSRAESAVLLVCFWNMSRSLPTSIPLVCMKRASGKRTALIRSAWFTRYSRTNLFPAVSATPLEVTKASRPPSESSSIALTKSSCEWSLWPVRRYRPFPQVGIEDTEVAERNV